MKRYEAEMLGHKSKLKCKDRVKIGICGLHEYPGNLLVSWLFSAILTLLLKFSIFFYYTSLLLFGSLVNYFGQLSLPFSTMDDIHNCPLHCITFLF